jgi:hypothetical protein
MTDFFRLKAFFFLIGLLVSSGNIHAGLPLTYEPFSYRFDSLLSDLADGGTGWSGSWKSSGTNLLRVERANAVNQGRSAASNRDLGHPFSLAAGTWYFSFIAKSDSAGRFNFNLRDTSGSSALIRWSFARNDDASISLRAGNATATSSPGLFLPDRTYLVISKFEGNTSTASVKLYDVATMDGTLSEPETWDLVSTGNTAVTLDNLDMRVSSGNVSIGEVRLGTAFAEMVPTIRNTLVFSLDHPATSEPMSWSHTVEEAGNYQIGLAWVKMLSGEDVSLEVFKNSMRVKAMTAPLGEVTRFETRLENLAAGDQITVRATPDNASYKIGYQIAFGTPTFDGLPIYHVDDFGAIGDAVTDDMAAIHAAVRHVRNIGGGIIHFDGDKVYRTIGAQDLEREFVFDLNGAKNILIQGNGAKMLLHPPDALHDISYAENIRIDGFAVDFYPKPYYQGSINAINVQNRTIDITVPDRYPVPQIGDAPTNRPFFGRSFIPDAPGARSGTGDNIYIESKTTLGNERELRLHIPVLGNGEPMEARMQIAKDNGATEFVVPHILYGHLGGHARIFDSARVVLSNIDQTVAPFFWLHIQHNVGPITLSNVNLKMPEPETELLASWRDGMHIKNSRWGVLVEDGDWDGAAMYDDLFAIYSRTQRVVAVSDNGVTLTPSFGGREVFLWQAGDWASFWSPDQQVLRGMARATSARLLSLPNFEVTFEDLPFTTHPDDIVIHEESLNRATVIRNNRTTNTGTKAATTRLRGTDVLFQDNHFEDFFFLIEFDPQFAPPRTRDVVIENTYIRFRDSLERGVWVGGTLGTTFRNCIIDDSWIHIYAGSQNVFLDGVEFINSTGAILNLEQSSAVWVFGNTSRNGQLSGLSDSVLLFGGSTISFTEPISYTPAIPPSDGADIDPPAAPGGLTSHIIHSAVWLYWERSPVPDFYAFTVYRSHTASGPFTLVASDLRINKWVDQDVSMGETYYYKVTSSDNSGNESLSSIPHEVTVRAPVQLVFENFNYPDGTSLSGDVARGGVGFLAGWQAIGTDILAVFDGKMTQTGSATRGILNTFELNSPDTYMSFLATSDANGEFAINLKETDGNFVRWAFARNADGSLTARGGNHTSTSAPGIFAPNTEYLVVSRFDTSTDTAYFKLFDTSNPGSLRTEPTHWDISASGNTGVTIDRIDVHLSSGTVTLDNLRIGRTYESVAVLDLSYDDWAAYYGLTGGPHDDDDNNGLSNLLEYALGGNPTDPADRGFPLVTHLVEAADKKWFEITYPRRAEFTGNLNYVVQVSQTLLPNSWSSSGLEEVEVIFQGYGLRFDSVTVRFEVTDMEHLFIRLLVEPL